MSRKWITPEKWGLWTWSSLLAAGVEKKHVVPAPQPQPQPSELACVVSELYAALAPKRFAKSRRLLVEAVYEYLGYPTVPFPEICAPSL
jgi:hypothetical protein